MIIITLNHQRSHVLRNFGFDMMDGKIEDKSNVC